MTLRLDGTLDPREQELLHFWCEFCQDRHAASFMSPTVGLADEFASWLSKQWSTEQIERQARADAASWWQRRDLGLFSWDSDLLDLWTQYSREHGSTDFVQPDVNAAHRFADWLANREPESRVRVEELDLSVRAFNLLRSRDVRFVDQIDLERLGDPLARKVKVEIAEKLGRLRGDDGTAGVPARL